MDYKETLHMPKTAFEMRGNLTKKDNDVLIDAFKNMRERGLL